MLLDTTLREGEQLYGAYFSPKVKKRLLLGVAALGVEEIELAASQEEFGMLLDTAARHQLTTLLLSWCPCRGGDVEQALARGARRIHVGIPVSDGHLRTRLGLSRCESLKRMAQVVTEARQKGAEFVSVGLEDCSRAEPSHLFRAAREAQSAGADRIRLADTVGLYTPLQVAEVLAGIRSVVQVQIGVHCHNDLGMATGNAVTALSSGADIADASLLGAGERAGIARLEELAMWLQMQGRSQYDLHNVRELCDLVGSATGLGVSRNQPVSGSDIFACETGLHVHGILRDPALFEPYCPSTVGATRHLAVGKKSGRAALRHAAARLGYRLEESLLGVAVEQVRKASAQKGRPLVDAELEYVLAVASSDGRRCFVEKCEASAFTG